MQRMQVHGIKSGTRGIPMINNTVLVGRLTKDPDLRYTGSGKAVASCTLAVNRDFKNADGEQEADFINCVFWGKTAEVLANHVKKGHQIGVVGRIQTRNYENQQGQRVYVTEVVVERLNFLEKRESNSNGNNQQSNNSGIQQNYNKDDDPFSGSTIDISDDDLPF